MTKEYYMQDESGFVFTTENPEYHNSSEKLTQTEGKRLHREQAIEKVTTILAECNTVYGIVRHVSASGMSRDIDLYVIRGNELQYLTGYASIILGYPMAKHRGMKVGGCGMDMVFHCVSSLAESCKIDYKTIRSEIL